MSHEAHIPDWELAMYRLGELQPARAEIITRRLADDPTLAARLEALDQREADLMERMPPRVVAAGVTERAQAGPTQAPRRRQLLWLAAPVIAVLLVLVLVLPPRLQPDPSADHEPSSIRSKGVDPFLRIYRKVPEGLEELGSGDPVGRGDRLQMAYSAMGCVHGAVFSLDGRGAVTLHHPLEGSQSAELRAQGTVDLPVSYVLDDAPGFERFFLVTGPEPFAIAPVLEAARTLATESETAQQANLPLPRGLDGYDFLLVKP